MKKVVSMIIALTILLGITSVKAADEKKLLLETNKEEIIKGEEVEITISSDELTGIEGTLEFESDDWTLKNKASDHSFTLNSKTGKFALANISGEEKISVVLTLKSKETTTATSSTIKVTGITGSDKSGQGFDISDKSVTIKFITPVSESNTIATNEYKEITSVKSESKNMPKTGSENVFAAITTLAVISTALYIGYKKNNY